MLKVMFFIGSTLWTLSTILVLVRPNAFGASCIHDEVVANVTVDEGPLRAKREDKNGSYDVLKIFTHFDEIDKTLTFNTIKNIEYALQDVTQTLSKIFKVRSMSRKFILQRQNCKRRWGTGINKGKCAEIQSGAEYCSIKKTDYIIPDKFLDDLEAYEEAGTKPHTKYIGGRGIDGYNFLLFVVSRPDAWCIEQDVQAYASYCRTDSSNRPIAGILNLCPDYFTRKIYDPRYYFNIIMHEILHVLGFSEGLFDKFKGCSLSSTCDAPKNIIQKDANGNPRMQFSSVIKATQEHFNCSNSDFGAPTASKSSDAKQSSSHWHPFLMFSSMMVPSFAEDDILVLDNITLSLFKSTGWYEIDYSEAEYFQFGKGKGCDFGTAGSCDKEKNTELCTVGDNKTSCDVMNLGVTQCQIIDESQPCGVFKPSFKESCDRQHESVHGIQDNELSYSQRCFIIGKSNPEPTCSYVKCSTQTMYEVLYNSSWVLCDKKGNDRAKDVTCIPDLPLCKLYTEKLRTSPCNRDDDYVVSLRMHFSRPTYAELVKKDSLKMFKVKTIHAIATAIGVPVSYVANATLSVFKQIFMDFSICPPKDISNAELGSVLLKTQKFLKSGVFSDVLKGSEDLLISSTDMEIHPSVVTTFTDYEGFRTLSAIPIICGIFVLTTLTASLIRLYVIQKHKPRRGAEPPSSDNLNDSSTDGHNKQESSAAL